MAKKLTLQQQIAQKEAQLSRLKNQQRSKERKQETRRLIYHGRLLEKFIEDGVISQEKYQQALERMLVRNYDREFFGLPLNSDEPKRERNSNKSMAMKVPQSQIIAPRNNASSPKAASNAKRLQENSVSEADFFT